MTLFLMPNKIFKSIQTELSKDSADPAMLKKFLGRHAVMQKIVIIGFIGSSTPIYCYYSLTIIPFDKMSEFYLEIRV